MFNKSKNIYIYWALSSFVLVHFLIIWLVRYSNEFIPGFLAITAFFWLVKLRFRIELSKQERALYLAMSLLPLSTLIRLLFDISYSPSAFDIQSRFLIAIPLMILIVRFGYSRLFLQAGLILAVFTAFYYMAWLTFDGQIRPKVNMNQITSANFIAYLGFSTMAFGISQVLKKESSRKWFILGILTLLVAFLAVILSKSRGSWLSIPFFLSTLLWIYRKSISKTSLALFIVLSSLVAILSVITPGSPVVDRISKGVEQASSFIDEDKVVGSIGTRLNMWQVSIEAFKLNPLFGLSEKGLQKFELESGIVEYEEKYGHQHSDFFDIIAKRGLVGLAFFVGFWVVFFWVFNKFTSSGYREAGLLLGVGYLVFGLTETTTGNYAAMSLLAVQTTLLFGAGHREWLLVHKPEILEHFSSYWPDRPAC